MIRNAKVVINRIARHPANKDKRFSAVLSFFAWQFYKRVFQKSLVINFNGMKVRCYPDSHATSALIYFNGIPDYREMSFMRSYLRPGDNFIDIGANVGVYSLLAASSIGRDGHIEAFEPNPLPAKRYVENMALNDLRNYTLHPMAVGESENTVVINFTPDDCCSHIVSEDCDLYDGGHEYVSCVTLDGLMTDTRYAMGKMDIEGAEPFALKGAGKHLAESNPPVWQIEMAGYSKRHGISTTEIIGMLDESGFLCTFYDPEEKQLVATRRPWSHDVQNVLAISKERVDLVTDRTGARLIPAWD